jgi:predicted enzyme related to lactoylglutathione lyase
MVKERRAGPRGVPFWHGAAVRGEERQAMSHLPGKFVWFEHVSSDIGKARAFYEPLFGWHVESMPMGAQSYSMIMNAGHQGIGGLTTAPAGGASHWQSYLSVDNVDASFASAIAAGAKSQMPPTDFGPVGRGAALTDPTGAGVSLWHSADADRPDAEQVAVGDWYWNELWTPDAKTALAFYERVFGYTHDAMDTGAHGTYYLLKSPDGKMRAGLMQSSDPKAKTIWLPYVRVADCDASAAKAGQLGAQVVVPPSDIPNVGRFAVLVDPLGAAVAVIKGTPGAI